MSSFSASTILLLKVALGVFAAVLAVYLFTRTPKRPVRRVGADREEIELDAKDVPVYTPTWRDMR